LNFSDEQLEVIDLSQGWHSCLAPAGSGKTEILTERVSRAVANGIDPKTMICLTFTNRAARSMQRRVGERIGERSESLFIGNTHAYALKLLESNRRLPSSSDLSDQYTTDLLWARGVREGALELLNKSPEEVGDKIFKLLESVHQLDINISDITDVEIRNAKLKITHEKIYERWNLKGLVSLIRPLLSKRKSELSREFVDYLKGRVYVLDSNISDVELPFAIGLALETYHLYEKEKRELHLYDFDDLLITAWESLVSSDDLIMGSYSWCQVDEVQDLSPVQWLIIKLLLAENANVLLLGDIRQSIYRFLGASVEVTEHNLGDSVFKLNKNYRSPKNLVSMADEYCKFNFGQNVKTESNKPHRDAALIHINRLYEINQNDVLTKHAEKLVRAEKSVAFLCPTNKMVEEYSSILSGLGLKHFKIGAEDVFNSQYGLDFISFLSVIHDPFNKLSWSRILWRFGGFDRMSDDERQGETPQYASMKLVSQLSSLGSSIHDFLGGRDSSEHFFRSFIDDTAKDIIYFDTETTGLSSVDDAIIQLAGVKVSSGAVSDEIDLYCSTDVPIGDSYDIHHIDEATLDEKGKDIEGQLKEFFNFSADNPLIAHNLSFDDSMLKSHIGLFIPDFYSSYLKTKKYCTLEISRRLFPDLESHKLGFLLDHFNLDGVNSHNALDDVKAGASLLSHLREEMISRVDGIDSLVSPYSKVMERFNTKFLPLWNEVKSLVDKNEIVDIKHLFDLFFEHVKSTKSYQIKEDSVSEVGSKICGHGLGEFGTDSISEYLDRCIPFYRTAKESDLITDDDKLIVSTIHRAKGLEFEHVILPNLVDGVMPGFMVTKMLNGSDKKQKKEAGKLLEEQKRLLYVALTRATDQLVVGTYGEVVIRGRTYQRGPSSFLEPVLHMFKKY